MRKLLLLLPLLFVPAIASAANNTPLQRAAYELKVSAGQLQRDAARLRVNRRIKTEVGQFALLSDRFFRRANYAPRSPRLGLMLVQLERAYYDMDRAFQHVPVRGKARKLRKGVRKAGLALFRVENQLWSRGRLALSRSQGGYGVAGYQRLQPTATVRRYRH